MSGAGTSEVASPSDAGVDSSAAPSDAGTHDAAPSDASAVAGAPDAPVDGASPSCPSESPQAAASPKPGCGRSAEEYQKQAEDQIAKAGPNMLDRNKGITRAYGDMYKSDPSTFKWAGMAAFASCEVGKGMREAQDAESGWKSVAGKVAGVDAKKLENALKTGNNAVYADIYWEHLAYQSCGIEELEKAGSERKINNEVLDAWRKIDAGKQAGDQTMIWEGNKQLLMYEQRTVLQKSVYDADPQLWKNVSSWPTTWYQKIDSPIPGDSVNFQDYVKDGNIGKFDDRWKWISKSMLPAWQRLDQNPTDAVNKLAPCVN